MNDIILSTQNGEPVVSSREVAKNFGKEHKDVLKAINNLVAQNCAAKSMFHLSDFENRGKKYPMYLMNRDGFSLLAMGFTGKEALEWKLKYIQAFNEMEKQYAEQDKKRKEEVETLNHADSMIYEMEKQLAQRPQLSRSELMAQALIAAHEELEHKDRQIAELTPKGIFADAVSASKKSILVGELAKLLCQNGVQIGQNRLFSWMRERGYLIKDPKRSDYNMPTQRAVEQGLFEIKETTVVHSDGHTSINKTPKVTGKGQIYFVNQFVKR
jgi:anti-repressor protein